jgi:phenylalanyl-tRNA synthetase beta chain
VNPIFTRIPPTSCFYTKPGATAQILVKNEPMGLVGELHPKVLANYDLKQTAFIFELDLDRLIQLLSNEKFAHPIPRYPATSRDITLIINKDVEASKIIQYVELLDEKLLETIHIFDVFEGDPIPEERKSVSLRITYRSLNETLEDTRINHIHKSITQHLVEKFDAALPAE